MNVNLAIVCGNITRDPELKTTPTGQTVCSFSVATNKTWFDKNNQKQERVEFHNIVTWGKAAENVAKYMRKGSQIYVEGELQTRNWDKDGVKHYRTEINARTIQFGARRNGSGEASSPAEHASHDGAEPEIRIEDIPF